MLTPLSNEEVARLAEVTPASRAQAQRQVEEDSPTLGLLLLAEPDAEETE